MYSLIRKLLAAALAAAPFFVAFPADANNVEEVSQVTGMVTLSTPVDYVVTSATPFAEGSVVDITNTDHAVLILKHVKPSGVNALISHVRINGQQAVDKTNCMVKIYANGSIIMPYSGSLLPLTVYTGLNQTGESARFFVSSRKSLLNQAVNNRIRSFVLKRGYMVTFATKADGKGYSRVFIADSSDLTLNLPPILDKSISSLRVMQWNDASKKGFAGRDATINPLLNTTWCYNWDAGTDNYADREYVTQRHHESGIKNGKYEGAWPSVEDCSNNGTSPHILGQNEPDNTGDTREVVTQVADLLAIWPDLMATGKRLGSPAMASNMAMLYEFLDSIDARGWRCDFVTVHSYWYSDWSSWQWNYNNIHNRSGRPLWITEMNYGANWTGWPAGDDRTGSPSNLAIEKQHMAPILDGIESTPYVERYAFYNAVQDCRAAYLNGSLTPIGEYYANIESKLAYSSAYEYVPKLPRSKGQPTDLALHFDAKGGTVNLSWYEPNGEYNTSMTVERRRGTGAWEAIGDLVLAEDAANYTFTDSTAIDGDNYRIHAIYADGKDNYSKIVVAVPDKVGIGDAVSVNGKTLYIGGNVLANGNFDLGMKGWTNGIGQTISQPHFEVFPIGGFDGGSYLQAFSHGGKQDVASLLTPIDLVSGTDYYLSLAMRFMDGVTYNHFSLTSDGLAEDSIAASIPSSTTWGKYAFTFNSGKYQKGIFTCRWLNSIASFDDIYLARLFPTRDEAIADGLRTERNRASVVQEANTVLPLLNDALSNVSAAANENSEPTVAALTSEIDNTLDAMRLKAQVDSIETLAKLVLPEQLAGDDVLQQALDDVKAATTAQVYIDAAHALKAALDTCLPFAATDKVVRPSFDSNSFVGWNVKTGSYTGNTQTTATLADKTSWSAVWTGISSTAGATQSMAINQPITGLDHGLYVLECKATTQHYCLSDQHAYLKTKQDSIVSPLLETDYLDVQNVNNSAKWQTLTTAPIYLTESDTISVGFTGSKQGAIDNAWREMGNNSSVGDMREGSWAATDFVLRHLPVYHATLDASGWSTICLPYAAKPTPGVSFYRIAGINTDSTLIYIKEISETAAGVPCIIHADKSEVVIQESGQPVTTRTYGDNNLRGMFRTSARTPQYALTLADGIWVNQDNPDRNQRPYLNSFQAFINNLTGVVVLNSWSGLSMPITVASSIRGVGTHTNSKAEYYSLDGRKVESINTPGVYVRVINGMATKVISKGDKE